jgi:hypothetical protein
MTVDQQLSTLLDLVKYEGTIINTLWNFYITVALAITGWFAAAGRDRLEFLGTPSRLVITAGFAAFTGVNILSLSRNYGILDSFLADVQLLLPKAMPDALQTASTLKPLSLWVWRGLGVPVSIIVELVVWILISLLILFFGRQPVSGAQTNETRRQSE